ncbi:MbtH family protein [Streptomyces xylophagus]|uniref:MbtH family protein n=1 Tax=Streptomyces xylophagus TaxID=285514 RepID=UPI000A786A25|nr:MbtH family NRPS accessory protein [Streptomyces xylophagus]
MANPFEDESAEYVVIRNAEDQYSLWPVFLDVPHGWYVVFREASRADCLEYIGIHWTDMRPKSLADAFK